jgi:hypothetical protein
VSRIAPAETLILIEKVKCFTTRDHAISLKGFGQEVRKMPVEIHR